MPHRRFNECLGNPGGLMLFLPVNTAAGAAAWYQGTYRETEMQCHRPALRHLKSRET
jgi:hypothetical protein